MTYDAKKRPDDAYVAELISHFIHEAGKEEVPPRLRELAYELELALERRALIDRRMSN